MAGGCGSAGEADPLWRLKLVAMAGGCESAAEADTLCRLEHCLRGEASSWIKHISLMNPLSVNDFTNSIISSCIRNVSSPSDL